MPKRNCRWGASIDAAINKEIALYSRTGNMLELRAVLAVP